MTSEQLEVLFLEVVELTDELKNATEATNKIQSNNKGLQEINKIISDYKAVESNVKKLEAQVVKSISATKNAEKESVRSIKNASKAFIKRVDKEKLSVGHKVMILMALLLTISASYLLGAFSLKMYVEHTHSVKIHLIDEVMFLPDDITRIREDKDTGRFRL